MRTPGSAMAASRLKGSRGATSRRRRLPMTRTASPSPERTHSP